MDLRTERTKKSILNAFLELRAKKPLEKITVKELSELALINKATFYSHYNDIYDLSEQLEDEFIASILKGIPCLKDLIEHPKQGVTSLALALHSQQSLLKILFSDSRASILADKLERMLKIELYKLYPDQTEILQWNILLTILTQGTFQAYYKFANESNMNQIIEILGTLNESMIKSQL